MYSHAASKNNKFPGVLFCGGFKSDMEGLKALALEDFCTNNDIAFTRFDYNGHGSSDGRFCDGNISSWLSDTLCIFNQVAMPQSGKGVVVIGSSMGAWIATLLASRTEIAGLMTLAAAPDFTTRLLMPSLTESQRNALERGETINLPSDYDDGSPYPITSQLIEDSRKHLVLETPFKLDAPVRLLHGTEDKDVPTQLSTELMNIFQSPDVSLTLIKNADHRLSSDNDLRTIIDTLRALLKI